MKEKLVAYRLITFILLPIAGLNAINFLFLLPSLLTNPLLLIGAFIEFAIIAYTFTSFMFFIKGVQNGAALKPSLKDWIKLNGIITLVFSILVLFCVLMVFLAMAGMSAAQFQTFLSELTDKMKAGGKTIGDVNARDLAQQLKIMFIIAGCYFSALLIHVIITLRLVKKYAPLFGNNDNRQDSGDLL